MNKSIRFGMVLTATALVVGGLWLQRTGRLRILYGINKDPGIIGRLGELRSALSIYYSDTAGQWPASLQDLIPKYVQKMPMLEGLPHPASDAVDIVRSEAPVPDDTGHWLYDNDPRYGRVQINCIHQDARGKPWSVF